MENLIVLSLWFFALTHVDTFFVLVAFCIDGGYRLPEILLGHYLGFGFGLLGAVLGAVVAAETLQGGAYLLGFVPLGIGLWGIVRRRSEVHTVAPDYPSSWLRRIGVVTVAGIGLSGENIAVFVPFFVTLADEELAVILSFYLVAAGVTFVIAVFVSRWTIEREYPKWIDKWLVPVTLIGVGMYVLGAGWVAG